MAKFLEALDDRLTAFIRDQKMFFTASAPHNGRVNISPKGLDTFRVLSPTRVGYLDATGSGNETAAHLKENGRLTLMWCAFNGPPLILRLYCTGRSVQPSDPEWSELRPQFGPPMSGERQLIIAEIRTVQTSCGFGVPLLDFREHRTQLGDWADRKGEEGVKTYRAEKNQVSIDGLSTGLVVEA